MKTKEGSREREALHGPVRGVPALVGVVVNLPAPLSQKRSLAAMLARKHRFGGGRLAQLGSVSRARELTEKECEAIFEAVGWAHGKR